MPAAITHATRSTAFRLAAAFLILFVALFVSASVVTYLVVRAELNDRVDEEVVADHARLAGLYDASDPAAFVSEIEEQSIVSDPERTVVLLTSADSERLAGNMPGLDVLSGFSTSSLPDLARADGHAYRLYSAPVGDMTLTFGRGLHETDEMLEAALASFGWIVLVALVLALVGGLTLAGRIRQRLDGISGTMERVAAGDLDARIPLTDARDELDTLSAQVNDALDRLRTLLEGLRQIGTDIAHDLKTPLNRMALTIEAAIEKQGAGGSLLEELEEARDEGIRINETFDALLRIAQIESGARKARFVPLDLTDIVATVAEVYADVAVDAGMVLTTEVGLGETTIQGDRELLIQMLVNLVENAIRHCGPGTDIVLSLHSDGNSCTLAVADDGPGVPEAERDKVTRRLYRLETSRTTPGNGLGLSLVKAIAELHGGKIALEGNAPGLRVAIRFPAAGDRPT